MKLIVKTKKPRNKLVAVIMFKKAGKHKKSYKSIRQKDKIQIKKGNLIVE